MVTYQVENIATVWDEAQELIAKHYDEIAWKRDKIKLDPDYTKYMVMNENGYVHVVTMRDGGVLVGYCVTIADANLHYKSTIYAKNDIIYIEPEYRKKQYGLGLMQFMENEMKYHGVHVITMHMKLYAPFEGLLEALGYEPVETEYSKYIGE